jgi:hypothetical protein
MELPMLHFYAEPIEVAFDKPPTYSKSPPCPSAFTWRGETYRITAMLAEWHDFRRRGRFARNMQPQHAEHATGIGSWGVGRFNFRVQAVDGRVFDIYYDRAPTDSDDRGGHWWLLGERVASEG